MVLSADAVARSVMSGENLIDVIPRACARGIVISGTKFNGLVFGFLDAVADLERRRPSRDRDREREPLYEGEYDLESDRDRDLVRRRAREREWEWE